MIPLVHDRYIYKGRDIERLSKKCLKAYQKFKNEIEYQNKVRQFVVIDNAGQGELALLLALMYPDCSIYCHIESPETREILKGCIDNFVHNVHVIDNLDAGIFNDSDTRIYEIMSDSSTCSPTNTAGSFIIKL